MLLKKFLHASGLQTTENPRNKLYRAFLRREAEIGGTLFGPVPKGGRREFFCLDKYTWIWHEEWLDAKGQRKVRTTRYDVRPNGIVKAQDGQRSYQQVTQKEAQRLVEAARAYEKRVYTDLYQPIIQA
jgi:hypothetical protein